MFLYFESLTHLGLERLNHVLTLPPVVTRKYDFLYLPIDFDRKANLGYAFINLVDQESCCQQGPEHGDRPLILLTCSMDGSMDDTAGLFTKQFNDSGLLTCLGRKDLVDEFWGIFDGFSSWSFPSSKAHRAVATHLKIAQLCWIVLRQWHIIIYILNIPFTFKQKKWRIYCI